MKTIPTNKILQSKGIGDSFGDIIESFNLDLSSNYGATRINRMKKVATNILFSDTWPVTLPIAFTAFKGSYYALILGYVLKGGSQPGEKFTATDTNASIVSNSDMKVFNGLIYYSAGTEIYKSNAGGDTFTTATTTGLAGAGPHLLEVANNRLYVTDSYTNIYSVSTANAIATSGAYTMNLSTALGIKSTDWSITCMKKSANMLWIGLLNISNGKGMVVSWDGVSENAYNAVYELPSGVVSGSVLDSIFYVIDTQGVLRKYVGSAFSEVARLFKKNKNIFKGSRDEDNLRFIHPNGMDTTSRGTILILMQNEIDGSTYEDTIPSGVYEYDPNVGLYHKYCPSISNTLVTTFTDYGQMRLKGVGAIMDAKALIPSSTINGSVLCGAEYYTGSSTTGLYGIFCDDSLNTTAKSGYFVTSKQYADILDQFSKVYAFYKKMVSPLSKIVVKYRTEEDTATEAVITLTDIDRFTTVTDISAYGVGDEVQILQGAGSGFSAHIKSINGGVYILDDNAPSTVIGLTAKASISHWKKAGIITSSDEKQFKALNTSISNISTFIQYKVVMFFTDDDEFNKLQIINKPQIAE